tara:strand:+ start:294 stop:1484 length:1191 start_codon:yes stop_codon:yes gene_type:complete
MALDWSGYQIPAYLAAKDMRDSGEDAGGLLGKLFGKAVTRQDIDTQNLSEALRGQGRSYHKDIVDKSGDYKDYDKWLEEEGGRFLQIAEAGGQFRNINGEWMLQTPDGKWETLGAKVEGDDGKWDPYAGGGDLNPFEKHMREHFLGDWMGGQYSYRSPKTALGALFSKERYKPVSNLYQYAAKSGLQSRYDELADINPNIVNFAALQSPKAGLGWYPGKFLSSDNILGKYINKNSNDPSNSEEFKATYRTGSNNKSGNGIGTEGHNSYYTFNTDGTRDETTISAKTGFNLKDKGINQEEFARLYKEHVGTAASPLTAEQFAQHLITGTALGNAYYYNPKGGGNPISIEPQLSESLKKAGIDGERFRKEYSEYLASSHNFPMSPEQWAKQVYKVGYR